MQAYPPHLLFSPVALAAYIVLGSGPLFFTYRWARRARNLRLARLLLVFFATLLSMIVASLVIDIFLFVLALCLLRLFSPPGLGPAVVLVLLGPILLGLVGAACSWFIGARVSRAFRDRD